MENFATFAIIFDHYKRSRYVGIHKKLIYIFIPDLFLARTITFVVKSDVFTELDKLLSDEILYDTTRENKIFIKKQIATTVWRAKYYRIWTLLGLSVYVASPFVIPLLGYRCNILSKTILFKSR